MAIMSWSIVVVNIVGIPVSPQILVFFTPNLSPLSSATAVVTCPCLPTVSELQFSHRLKRKTTDSEQSGHGDQLRLREYFLLFWLHRHHWTVYEEILTNNFFSFCYIAL